VPHFDWTISLGNIIMGGTFLVCALLAWCDLTWRVRNLELWRSEHMVDSDARDNLIRKLESLSDQTKWQSDTMFEYFKQQGMRRLTAPPTKEYNP
jgi:hypothetical protein